jgi:chemotaxis-related protein WspB
VLALLFEISGEKFAIPAARVVSVIRRPVLRHVPGVPAWIGGVFRWRELWAPVVDLPQRMTDTPCPEGAANRVAVFEHVRGDERRPVGLLAPGMTRVADLSGTQLSEGIHTPGQAFLGAIVQADEYGVQLVDVDRILPPELESLLFRARPAERRGE